MADKKEKAPKKETSKTKKIKKQNKDKQEIKVDKKIINKNKKEQKKIDIEKFDEIIKEKLDSNIENESNNKNVKEKNKKYTFGIFEFVVLFIIIMLIFLSLGYIVGNNNKKEANNSLTIGSELQTFIEQYNNILENYYGDIDKETLISGAINGMLSTLDNYSEFISKDDSNFTITLEGSYDGIGIGIGNNSDGQIVILKVYANTPANKAGLKENDIIEKINGTDLTNYTSTQLVNMIKNVDEINLTILRSGEEFAVKLIKEKITLDSVYYEMKEDNIGYIQVTVFANNTYEQFKKALENLEQNSMKSLIIDLRGNSGGHLSAVEQMLSLFVDDSHIIYQTEDNAGVIDKFYSKGNVNKEYPIVILQNGSSASASELMASSLRENLNAYIIGTKSYGKGTVQELQTISGIGQYKFTTKKWLTPNGNWINDVGVQPDEEVSLGEEYLQNPSLNTDNQYQTALKYLAE